MKPHQPRSTQIMQTFATTGTLGKLVQESQDTFLNGSSTIYCWNTSRAQQIELMSSRAEKTMTQAITPTMTTLQYGQKVISASTTCGFESWISTCWRTLWNKNASAPSIRRKKSLNDGPLHMASLLWTAPTGITGLPWLSWKTTRLGGE